MVKVPKIVVKNIFEWVFPPRCRGCGRVGTYLCECCKNYILGKVKFNEIPKDEQEGVFVKAGWIGAREGILGEIVEEYKYFSVERMAGMIAEIVTKGAEEIIPKENREKVVLVTMPTSRKHIKERGFDHMERIGREIEKRAKAKRVELLLRAKDTVQVGASEEVRRKQAKEAVKLNPEFLTKDGKLKERFLEKKIVLVDDVWTTGASMREAGRMLKKAGVKRLYGVAIAKNRDGKSPQVKRGDF